MNGHLGHVISQRIFTLHAGFKWTFPLVIASISNVKPESSNERGSR
jgi:hypothetical protein